jgi:hypothetical protein
MSNIFGPGEVIDGKKGTRMTVIGNCWTEKESCDATEYLAMHNAQSDPDIQPDAGWTPPLYGSANAAEHAKTAYERVMSESRPARAYNDKN